MRAVVLRGAGRCFSAGHDLGDIAAGEQLPSRNYQSNVIERLADLKMPVISAVHGHCYTGALELALSADIIFAAEFAKFGDTHAQLGADPGLGPQPAPAAPGRNLQGAGNDVHLPHLFGSPGGGMGLANACVAEASSTPMAELTAEITANSSFSHAANKRLLIETDGLPQPAGLAHEIYRGEGRGPDMAERIAAFTSKAAKK